MFRISDLRLVDHHSRAEHRFGQETVVVGPGRPVPVLASLTDQDQLPINFLPEWTVHSQTGWEQYLACRTQRFIRFRQSGDRLMYLGLWST